MVLWGWTMGRWDPRRDIVIQQLLSQGRSISDISRTTGASRRKVRSIRDQWSGGKGEVRAAAEAGRVAYHRAPNSSQGNGTVIRVSQAGRKEESMSTAEVETRLDRLEALLKGLESRLPQPKTPEQERVESVEQNLGALKGALDQVQTTLATEVAPVVKDLKEAAPTIKSLCELYPDLCKVAEEHKAKATLPEKPEAGPHVEVGKTRDPHTLLNQTLTRLGKEILGHPPSWGDLLDLCPDGTCAQAAARAVAKRPQLLEYLIGQEGVAAAMLEALKRAGKLPQKVDDHDKRIGYFRTIPRSR